MWRVPGQGVKQLCHCKTKTSVPRTADRGGQAPGEGGDTRLSTGQRNANSQLHFCCPHDWTRRVVTTWRQWVDRRDRLCLAGFSVDWWALGVLMFEMMAGRSPFDIITDNPDMNTEDYLFQGDSGGDGPQVVPAPPTGRARPVLTDLYGSQTPCPFP